VFFKIDVDSKLSHRDITKKPTIYSRIISIVRLSRVLTCSFQTLRNKLYSREILYRIWGVFWKKINFESLVRFREEWAEGPKIRYPNIEISFLGIQQSFSRQIFFKYSSFPKLKLCRIELLMKLNIERVRIDFFLGVRIISGHPVYCVTLHYCNHGAIGPRLDPPPQKCFFQIIFFRRDIFAFAGLDARVRLCTKLPFEC